MSIKKTIYNYSELMNIKITRNINTARIYFILNIILRYTEAFLDLFIEKLNGDIKSVKNYIDIEDQIIYDVIIKPNNTVFYFKKYSLRGANIENKLFEKIDEFNRIQKFDKLCIYIHTTKKGLELESGKRLRKYLTFSKEDSPIIYSYLSELITTKAVAYVDLIGIMTKKDESV